MCFRRECDSTALWRSFCLRTGKVDESEIDAVNSSNDSTTVNTFRDRYYKTPCVPVDFASITSALSHCPWQGTITLLPGVYEERLSIRKAVHIRAAYPAIGAAIVWYRGIDEPCIAVTGDLLGNRNVHVMLSHLQLFHSTDGVDIWGGNCAVLVEGNDNRLDLTSCSLQSDSGRGVVAVEGAILHLQGSVIHDCAATGLYLGDSNSMASIKCCNIIRNGAGSRRLQQNSFHDDESERVPAGHSGCYVEAGMALIENSLLAGNSLTGLSVVRGGIVRITDCDITENGSNPILVEDAFDFDPSMGRHNQRQGGVVEGPVPNNYISRNDDIPSLEEELALAPKNVGEPRKAKGMVSTRGRIVMGGMVRATQFDHVVDRRMPTEALESRYRLGSV